MSRKKFSWSKVHKLENTFKDTDAVLILTEWKEYSYINWESVSKLMRSPSWVFDLRSVVNPQEVLNTNLKLWRVGDGSI